MAWSNANVCKTTVNDANTPNEKFNFDGMSSDTVGRNCQPDYVGDAVNTILAIVGKSASTAGMYRTIKVVNASG